MLEGVITPLPPGELGDGRHLQIDIGGGTQDTRLNLWQAEANTEDPYSAVRFSLAHGMQTNLFAALAGFLVRAAVPAADTKATMLEAGQHLLADIRAREVYYEGRWILKAIASGEPFPADDIEELGLESLGRPVPQAPGTVETSGGTGLYTRRTPTSTLLVVRKTHGDHESIEFCKTDVPIMARLVCRLAIGDYRPDFQDFLRENFLDPS